MSAKDAPGEVNNKTLFDSPNISASEETTNIKPEVDKEAEERKKRETVNIDGIPIDDKDIKFKAADIRKKQKMKYFVHVTDASKYEKQAARRKAQAKRAAEQIAAEEKREAERKEKEAATAAIKKQAEEKKHIDEVNAYVKQKKRENAAAAKKETRGYAVRRRAITIGAIVATVLIVVGVVATLIISNAQRIADEEAEKRRLDEEYVAAFNADPVNAMLKKINDDERIVSLIENYQFAQVYPIYDEYLYEVTDNHVKAYVYLDLAEKIRENTTDEEAEIVKVLEKARNYQPEDRYVLSHLQTAYWKAGQTDKAEEVKKEIDRLSPLEVRIGDDSEVEEGGEG